MTTAQGLHTCARVVQTACSYTFMVYISSLPEVIWMQYCTIAYFEVLYGAA